MKRNHCTPPIQTSKSEVCIRSDIFRDLALEVLLREPDGSFLVRESHSRGASGLALSVRVPLDFHPGGIAHYLIVRAPKGFRIKVRCIEFERLVEQGAAPEINKIRNSTMSSLTSC